MFARNGVPGMERLPESKLRLMLTLDVTEANINEFGRFDELKATADAGRVRAHFEAREGTTVSAFRAR